MAQLKDERREVFAKAVVQGVGMAEAYKAAFPEAGMLKEDVMLEQARELYSDEDVMSRVDELQQGTGANGIITRERRMSILSTIALDDTMHPKHRMAAIDILNKMDNEYVKRIEAVVSTKDMEDTAAAVAAILDE